MKHLCIAILAGLAPVAAASADTTVDFESGNAGWLLQGLDTPTAPGNPGLGMNIEIVDTFGINISNDSNPDFIGDYGAKGNDLKVSADFYVDYITFFGTEVQRDVIIELRDYDNVSTGYPWASVWLNAGPLPAPGAGWVTYEWLIPDTGSATLPAGWGGYGDEDPNTFEPILPADRTYADVLAGVDEIVFTTFVPGFFYGFTNFKMGVDNISIAVVPAPASVMLLGVGAVAGLRRKR